MANHSGDFTPVVKVDLKRVDPLELVQAEERLSTSAFVTALGADTERVLKLGLGRRYPDKVVVFQQGDTGDSLFFVLRGEVRLFARKDRDSVELGSAVVGDVFGEGEVLDARTLRGVSAVAQGDVDVLEIARRILQPEGSVPEAVRLMLTATRAVRQKRLDELTDFINRW